MNSVDSVVKRAPVKKTISGRKSRVRLPEWVTMNVGGTKFMTRREHFKAFPNALLGQELTLDSPHYNRVSQEFMFDRNPEIFACILDYYRTGELHFPHQLCGPSIKKELYYWGIDENEIAPCCWSRYKEYEEQEQTLQKLGKAFNVIDPFDKRPGTSHWVIETIYRWRERIWVFLEDPKSSVAAGLWAMLYMLLIFTSVLTLALETHSQFRIPTVNHYATNDTMLGMTTVKPLLDPPKVRAMQETKPHEALNVVDLIINIIFAINLLLRLIMSPNKIRFLKSWMNWLDIVVVTSQWVTTGMIQTRPQNPAPSWTAAYSIISIIRVARVFLIFKLARHYTGLRILLLALRASITELLLLIVFVVIGMFIFSTLIFYAELYTRDQEHFGNIPVGFWWAIVTMTTVGYGDTHPMSSWGYLVGALCALTGMLATGLPIPIIANNFTLYYSVSKQKSRMDAREEQPGLLSIKSMKARMKKLADDFADVSQSAITKVFKKSRDDESTDEFDEEEEYEELEREEQERLAKEKEKEEEKERESTPDPYKKEGKVSEVRKKFEEAKQKQDGVVLDASKNGSTDDLDSKTKDRKDGKTKEQNKSKDSSDKKTSKDKESKDKESKSKDKESKDKESKSKDKESKDKESKDKESKSKDKDSKDKESKSKDKDSKDKESKSKDKDSKDKESKSKDKDSKDKESKSKDKDSKDKESKSKDKEPKDKESKDKDSKTKDKESKVKESKDKESKDRESNDKDSKDKQSKDKDSKDKQSKDKESKDKPPKDSKTKDTKDADDKTKDSKEKKDTSNDKPTIATEYDKKKKADTDDKTRDTKEKKDTSNDKRTVATELDKKKKNSDEKKDNTPEKERKDKKETKDKGKSKEGKKEDESDQKEDEGPQSKESTPEPLQKVTLATDRPYAHDC